MSSEKNEKLGNMPAEKRITTPARTVVASTGEDVDPEMLKNLDLLMDYDLIENSDEIEAIEQLEELEKAEASEVNQ